MAQEEIGIRVVVGGVAEAHRQLGAIRNDLSRVASDIGGMGGHFANFSKQVVKAGDAMVSFGRTLTFAVTAPIIGLETALLSAAIGFEDAFAGVSKTVDDVALGFNDIATEMYGTSKGLTQVQKDAVFANEKFGDLTENGEALRNRFRELALDIPVAATELSKIGQIAGQLGVPSSQLEKFTKIIATLGVTTDLNSEQAAFAIARLGNIMGIESENIGEFATGMANAIVSLGNNAAATESEITNLALRLAAAGRSADLSTQEILGLSASLAEMGVKAERGGTAVSRVLYEMIFAIADGSENLGKFAEIAGISVTEFSALFKKDAVGALDLFMTRLADLQDTGAITEETLTALGLSGVRVREVLNILGPNMESVRENIERANTAWTEQIALQEEATKRFNTFKSQLQLLRNAFTDLGITIFDLIKDDLTKFVTFMKDLIKSFKDLDPVTQKAIIRFGAIAAAIGPVVLILGTFTQLAGNAGLGLGLLLKPLEALIRLPFSPLLGLFSTLFGKKGVKGAGGLVGGIKSISKGIGGVFSNIFGVIPKVLGGILKTAGGVVNSFFKDVAKGASIVVDTFANVGKDIVTGAGSILKAISSLFLGPVSMLFTGAAKVLTLPFDLVGGILKKTIIPLVGNFGKIFTGVIGGVAKGVAGLGGKLLGFVPTIGKFFFSGILGIFTKLPLLFGSAIALMFAPKIISGLVKNWDAVLGELKTSVSQFAEDVKKEGLTKAIMLFVSGGSTGSGRKGGIFGIAKAMGASEDSAKKFSYALGVATHWIVKIVGSFGELIKRLGSVVTGTNTIGGAAISTSSRLAQLTASFAKFFEGFYVGWTGKFDKIVATFVVFIAKVREAASSFSTLFDEVFGTAVDKQRTFQEGLEPGIKTTASSIGETVGAIVGDLLTLAIQTLTLMASVAGKIAEAFTAIVSAYREGGLKEVFQELEPILSGLFQGILFAADALWDSIKPKLQTFVDSAVAWFKSDGGPALLTGISNLITAIGAAFNGLWQGFNIEQTVSTTTAMNIPTLDNSGKMSTQSSFYTGEEDQTMSFEGLKPKLERMIEDIKTFLSSDETKQSIKDGFAGALNGLVDVAKYLWEGGEGFGGLKGPLNELKDSISSWVETEGVPKAKEWGDKIGRALVEAMKEAIWPDNINTFLENSGVKAATEGFAEELGVKDVSVIVGPFDVKDSAGNVIEEFTAGLRFTPQQVTDIEQRFEDAGLIIPPRLQKGLEQGFLDTENARLLAGYDFADDIINAVKEQAGINSPSTVFQEIGVNMMEGLIIGLDSQFGALDTSIATIKTKFLGLQISIVAIALEISNKVSSMLTNLNSVANIASIMSANLSGSTTSISSTSNSVYSPTFMGPPAPAAIQANQDMYSQYLQLQAVG